MTTPAEPTPAPAAPLLLTSRRHKSVMGLMWLLFAGIGFSTITYATVWFRLLEVIIGTTLPSVILVVVMLFAGISLGCLLFDRLVPQRFHPLRLLAILQLATGVAAIIVTLLVPLLDRIYTNLAHPGAAGVAEIIERAMVCAICLIPPGALLGATLPAAARVSQVRRTGEGTPGQIGPLFGAALLGAAMGILAAQFFLLPRFDLELSIYLSVATSGLLGAFAMLLAGWTGDALPPLAAPQVSGAAPAFAPVRIKAAPRSAAERVASASIYFSTALGGATVLGASAVWGRILAMLLGDTLYAHAIILAALLLGLALGCTVGSMLVRSMAAGDSHNIQRYRFALGWSQALGTLGITWSAYAMIQGLLHWPVTPSMALTPRYEYQIDLARCLWATLPASLCWGAAIPLALAAARADAQPPAEAPRADDAKIVGRVFAAALAGALVGHMVIMLLLPIYQTADTLLILAGIAIASAVVALAPGFFAQRVPGPYGEQWVIPSQARLFWMLARILLVAVVAGWCLQGPGRAKIPESLVVWGRLLSEPESDARNDPRFELKGMEEGAQETVAVTETYDPTRKIIIRKLFADGSLVGSTTPDEMRAQLILGHLPALVHGAPASALVLGCGTGTAAGCFILHPETMRRIVIVEQDPLIIKMAENFFGSSNNGLLDHDAHGLLSKNVEVVIDDPRHFLRTTRERFDIIVNNPRLPEVAGAARLYTREYFQDAKDHLNAGGLFTHHASVVGLAHDAAQCEMATFFSVFPKGTLWNAGGSEIVGDAIFNYVLMSDCTLDADSLVKKFDAAYLMKRQLAEAGLNSAQDLLKSYGGSGVDIKAWAGDILNDDRNLQLSYRAAADLNTIDEERIAGEVLARRRYPDFIKASPEMEKMLRSAWGISQE